MKTILQKLVLSTLVILTLNSCKKTGEITESQKLSAAQKTWQSKKFLNYSFRVTCICDYTSSYQVTVSNKVITAVKNPQGQDIQFSNLNIKTIDEFFQFIDVSIKKNPYKTTTDYDKVTGVPTRIYINFAENIIDEEVDYRIENFQPK